MLPDRCRPETRWSRPDARAGDLTAPDGRCLERIGDLAPKQARAAVTSGALLAFESCGCGGYADCPPVWVDEEVRSRLVGKPRLVRGYGAPTWIDLWRGDGVEAVLAHGDVEW